MSVNITQRLAWAGCWPESSPAVAARGDELCIGGLGLADHKITLLKGLPSLGGETLASNQDADFTFGDRPPYIGFAGDGVILPREDADGVGIESINVSRLAIEVWRETLMVSMPTPSASSRGRITPSPAKPT